MLFSKADCVYDVYQPMHFISRSIGLTSFSLKTEKGKMKASTTCLSLCIIISTTLMNLVLAHRFVTKNEEMWIINEKILPRIFIDVMYYVILTLSIQTIILQGWTFCAKGSFAIIFNLLRTIDNEILKQCSFRVDYTKQRKYFAAVSLFGMVSIVFSMTVNVITSDYNELYKLSISQSVSMGLCMSTSTLLMCQFFFFIWMTKMRFRQVNFFLIGCCKRQMTNDHMMKETLKKMANIHDLLVDVTENINKCFGVPVSSQGNV